MLLLLFFCVIVAVHACAIDIYVTIAIGVSISICIFFCIKAGLYVAVVVIFAIWVTVIVSMHTIRFAALIQSPKATNCKNIPQEHWSKQLLTQEQAITRAPELYSMPKSKKI